MGMEKEMSTKLWIVVPCYNEEEVLPITQRLFLDEINLLVGKGKISDESRVLFVDDGSKDKTWQIINELARKDRHFIGIQQSRNRGHQAAVLAGLMEAKKYADITISIDADGQDDVSVMEQMVDEYLGGCEIVYGVRDNRDTDTFFKKFTAQSFYKMMNKMGTEVVYNHADYRLVSTKVLNEFENYREVNLFLRGMFPLIGFKSTSVYYKRADRLAGKSHYPLRKMLALAVDGITSLSVKPLNIIITIGLIIAVISFIGIIWAIITHATGNSAWGWSSIICVVCFLSGVQLLSLGIIGVYVGKIYMETKQRPRYIISERTYERND